MESPSNSNNINSKSGHLSYKERLSFAERKDVSDKFLSKYSNRFPIIVEPVKNSGLSPLKNFKYAVEGDLSVCKFWTLVRKNIEISAEQAIFGYAGNELISGSMKTIAQIYQQHADEDRHLYIYFTVENTFG